METRLPITSPQDLGPQDDGGLWMKMDFNPVTDHTETARDSPVTSSEGPRDETNAIPPDPAAISRYYSVMDDEDTDNVFILPPLPPLPSPPPSYIANFMPAGGNTGATVSNSSVTLINGAGDATGAKSNPSGLHWHHEEKQLMAAPKEVDEVIASTTQTWKESTHTVLLCPDQESIPPTLMEGMGSLIDPSGGSPWDNLKREDQSNEDAEDIVILRGGKENWGDADVERDKTPKQRDSYIKENSENETLFYTEGDQTGKRDLSKSLGVFEDKVITENVNYDDVETDAATNQPQAEILTEVDSNDNGSLNYNVTKYAPVRRDSSTSEMQVPKLPISEGSPEEYLATPLGREQQGDSWTIATHIQQGEQLLQRLQLVQQRQDVHMSESPSSSQRVVQERRPEEKALLGTGADYLTAKGEDLAGKDDKEERTETAVMEKGKDERNDNKDEESKARMSSSMMPAQPKHHMIASKEADNSEDDQSDSWDPTDWSQVKTDDTASTQAPFLSNHRFSAAETSIERQIQEATQRKQNLQRAGALLNLTDNPDVLEIPFKTNFSLEPLPAKVGPGQRREWQFSEQKMQKEISQEIQRELVLVNQGKIPGGYSKGEVRQLKETKLLFEAFQQDHTEGPTRLRKPPSSLTRGLIYPSVLERTRSLEMVSLKSSRISRAHSLRLCKSPNSEREKSPESLRSSSPTGVSWDKTRLSPYPAQDKHLRLYRSMDSISTDVHSSAAETRSKTPEARVRQGSPILKQNPFFKLRPALALQPEVEKDIREAREREEELRRQRCTLYGENRQSTEEDEKSQSTSMFIPGKKQPSRGKLERVWPPPAKKEPIKPGQAQQEPKVYRAGGQKAPLWQQWESGQINGQPSKEKN